MPLQRCLISLHWRQLSGASNVPALPSYLTVICHCVVINCYLSIIRSDVFPSTSDKQTTDVGYLPLETIKTIA